MSIRIRPSDPESGKWRLHPRVALRSEPFGALAYHYDSRKLNFLRSPQLVELVRDLELFDSPRRAFDQLPLDALHWSSYAKALDALARSNFLEPIQQTASEIDEAHDHAEGADHEAL